MAYKLIEYYKLTGSQSSIVIDQIPDTYTDLIIKTSFRVFRTTTNYREFYVKVNDSTDNSLLSSRYMENAGGIYIQTFSNQANALQAGLSVYNSATSQTHSNNTWYIPNYASSNPKIMSADGSAENFSSDAKQGLFAMKWAGTAPINKLEIFDLNDSNFMAPSSFAIYGVLAGNNSNTSVS